MFLELFVAQNQFKSERRKTEERRKEKKRWGGRQGERKPEREKTWCI